MELVDNGEMDPATTGAVDKCKKGGEPISLSHISGKGNCPRRTDVSDRSDPSEKLLLHKRESIGGSPTDDRIYFMQ